MPITSESLDELEQQTENSLRHLNELWQRTEVLPTLHKQLLTEALSEHCLNLQELQVAIEELRCQNQELAVARQVVEAERWQLLKSNQQLQQEIAERKLAEATLQQLNTDLERQVQERTAQLQQCLDFEAMLKRITDQVRDSLDESKILPTVVQELAVVLGINGCNIGLYDAERTTSTISHEYTNGIPPAQGRMVQMADFSEGYNQLLKSDYFQFCEFVPSFLSPAAMLACPIFDDRGVLGDLWLFKQGDAAFNEQEIRLVQQVASQCAIAIRQARLYQAAQARVEELQKLSRLKDDFLSTVSHELRTPVANMKMAIQMLGVSLNREQMLFAELAKPAAQQSRVARYFQILHKECEREIKLINNILDLQHIYAGVHALVLTSIQLQDWLPQILEPFQERVRNRQLSLQINIAPEVPRLICDPASLERVLAELLENACKYTPPGEKIVVTAKAQSGMMQLSVTNSGIEIPASELPRIFDKFYRIPNADPWKQGGTGLGLALVQQLVAHLGGKIHVESAGGQTRFTLELPLDRSLGVQES